MARRPGARQGRREPKDVEWDARAVALRKEGLSYQQIADALGCAVTTAKNAITRGLADSVSVNNEEVRELDNQRLDEMTRVAWKIMTGQHYRLHDGLIVRHPTTREPLFDPMPSLAAIDRLLKIMGHRADVYGFRADTRVQVITSNAIDAEIARLAAELGEPVRDLGG